MMKYIYLRFLFITIPWVTCDQGCGNSKYKDAGEIYRPPGAQIVGGIEARPNEFPWQVSLRYACGNVHFCGGMIISKSWIMTAAHCFINVKKPSDFFVVVGEHDITATSSVRKSHNVEKFIIHEKFDCETLDNDIALIKVTPNIDFNRDVTLVCLPKRNDLYVHWKSLVSGWGLLAPDTGSCKQKHVFPRALMYTTLNITTNEFCRKRHHSNIFSSTSITGNMMCTSDNKGDKNSDSCQGDSGGPVTVKDSKNVFSVVGIVSNGKGCASGYPGVNTRVSRFINWINDKISLK